MVDDSKRAALRGFVRVGLGVLAAGTALGTAKAQDQKVAQNLVQYQTTPKEAQECDKCVNWVAPNSCKIVAGTISPKGWCIAFAPKES